MHRLLSVGPGSCHWKEESFVGFGGGTREAKPLSLVGHVVVLAPRAASRWRLPVEPSADQRAVPVGEPNQNQTKRTSEITETAFHC